LLSPFLVAEDALHHDVLAAQLVTQVSGIVSFRALVFGNEISVPALIHHDLQNLLVGDGALFKVLVHVIELRVAGVGIRQNLDDVLGLGGIWKRIPDALAHWAVAVYFIRPCVLEGAEIRVDAEVLGLVLVCEFEVIEDVLPGQRCR
jgi:hypothetical protein